MSDLPNPPKPLLVLATRGDDPPQWCICVDPATWFFRPLIRGMGYPAFGAMAVLAADLTVIDNAGNDPKAKAIIEKAKKGAL